MWPAKMMTSLGIEYTYVIINRTLPPQENTDGMHPPISVLSKQELLKFQ